MNTLSSKLSDISYVGEYRGVKVFRGSRPKSHSILVHRSIFNRLDLSHNAEKCHKDLFSLENPKEYHVNLIHSDHFVEGCPHDAFVKDVLHKVSQCKKSVFLHCSTGANRTGYICAILRFYQGWGYRRALKEMFSFGFMKFPYLYWMIPLFFQYLKIKFKQKTLT